MRLHRLDLRVKLAALLAVVVAVFVLGHPLGNAVLAAVLFGVLAAAGLPMRGMWTMLRPLWPVFLLIVVVAALTGGAFVRPEHAQVLFSLWGMDVTVGGLLVGLNFVARIVVMVIATYAFTASTSTDDLLLVLSQLRVPTGVSLVIALAISFIPAMVTTKDQIVAAQQARGVRPTERFGRIAGFVPVMVPLITNAILLANRLGVTVVSRGFGAHRTMTAMSQSRLRTADLVVLGLVLLVLAGVLWLRFGLGHGVV